METSARCEYSSHALKHITIFSSSRVDHPQQYLQNVISGRNDHSFIKRDIGQRKTRSAKNIQTLL